MEISMFEQSFETGADQESSHSIPNDSLDLNERVLADMEDWHQYNDALDDEELCAAQMPLAQQPLLQAFLQLDSETHPERRAQLRRQVLESVRAEGENGF